VPRLAIAFVLALGLAATSVGADEPLPAPPAGPLAPMPTQAAMPEAPPAALPADVPSATALPDVPAAPAPADAPAAPPVPASEPLPPAPPAPPAVEIVGSSATVVAAPSGGCCGACAPSCCDPCRRPSLDVQGHIAWINGLEGPLTVASGDPAQVTWDGLDYGATWGGRVAYHAPLGSWTLTVGGTFWGEWDDEAQQVGTLAASPFPGGPPDVSPTFLVGYEAESTLWGIDLDITREVVCSGCLRAGWGFGVRYIGFDEDVLFSFTQPVAAPGGAQAEADNRLLALQAVGYAAWRLGGNLELRARGAVFAGWQHQEVDVLRTTILPPPGPTAEDDTFGFGAELEIEARWRLSRCWSIGIGYGAIFLLDQARGEQAIGLDETNSGLTLPRIVEDDIFAHRVFVGLTFEF
jgi:hypothetical protein